MPLQDGDRTSRIELNVLPRQRVKDTRAAVIAEAAGSTYIHPAALFALSQAEIAHHSEAPRDYSGGYGTPTMHRTRRPKKRMEPLERRIIPSDQCRKPISTT